MPKIDVPQGEERNEALLRVIAEHICRHYARDVSLVLVYGSVAQGRQTPSSDLDLAFIPCTDRGRTLSMTFILEGVGYDFFPISWNRLRRQVEGRDAFLTYVRGARVVFAASPEVVWRYEDMCQRAELDIHRQGYAPVQRTEPFLDRAFTELGRIAVADNLAECRGAAGALLERVMDALHVMNRHFDRPGRNWTETLYSLPRHPEGLREKIEAIVNAETCTAILDTARDLLAATIREHRRMAVGMPWIHKPAKILPGVLEEIRSNWYHKIIGAAEDGDAVQAFVAGAAQQRLLDQVAKEGIVLPVFRTTLQGNKPTYS